MTSKPDDLEAVNKVLDKQQNEILNAAKKLARAFNAERKKLSTEKTQTTGPKK